MHHLFIGVTMSGKTTLARSFSRELLASGKSVVVYDPLGTDTKGGDWGEKALVFHDREKFLEFMYSDECRNVHIFVDEAHHIFHHTMGENFWMLTEGRHHFMYFYLISQRPKKIHPDVRTGCARCYMFRLAQDDAKEIGADYGHSNIHKENLDTGDFLVLNSGSAELSRANVFNLLEKPA
jgi:DNA helicase HerA-like ATPase